MPPRPRKKKIAIPAEFRRRMQTEHGGTFGDRMVLIGNFYSYGPRAAIAKKYGLMEDDLTILSSLCDWGDKTATVIAALASRPRNSISRAVIRLTALGFIQSRLDNTDRRKALLTVTPAGRELHDQALQPYQEREEWMFSVLTEDEREALDVILLKLLSRLSEEFVDE